MNIDNGEILDCGLECMPSQSPDRKRTVFTQRGPEIQLMDVDDSNREDMDRHQSNMFSYTYWNLGWSHDSQAIAFKARNRRTAGEDIVVADIDSPDDFQILLESSKGVRPDYTFCPDNRPVMFAMNDPNDGVPQLYTVDRINPDRPQQFAGQRRDWKIFNCDSIRAGRLDSPVRKYCSRAIGRPL